MVSRPWTLHPQIFWVLLIRRTLVSTPCQTNQDNTGNVRVPTTLSRRQTPQRSRDSDLGTVSPGADYQTQGSQETLGHRNFKWKSNTRSHVSARDVGSRVEMILVTAVRLLDPTRKSTVKTRTTRLVETKVPKKTVKEVRKLTQRGKI